MVRVGAGKGPNFSFLKRRSTKSQTRLSVLFLYGNYLFEKSHWQDLNIEEYDWYGYGETYGSEAKLRTDYRYKQVRVL